MRSGRNVSHMKPLSGLAGTGQVSADLNSTQGREPEFVSVTRAAELLGRSRWQVTKLLDSGVIESEYEQRRKVRLDSLAAYVSANSPEPS